MSFDLNLGAGGDATADAPAVSEPTADVAASTGVEAPIPPTIDSGVDAPADPSLTTELTEADPNAPPLEPPAEDEEAALLAAANDPNTPQWARDKIKQAMGYAGKLKAEKATFETQANELRTQYEGKEVVAPDELQWMRTNDEKVRALQSVAAKPEDIVNQLKELNPRAYPEVQNHLVWNAVTDPDGTPNYANLQVLIDNFAGEAGKVDAKDVLQAINGLKSGAITPDSFHQFDSAEQYESWQRTQAHERTLAERETQINENARFQEQQIRQGELSGALSQVQQQLDTQIGTLLDKFKLNAQPNEPQVVSDYKSIVNERIKQIVSTAPSQIPAFGELMKAVEILGKPGDKAVDAQTAVAEVRAFINSPSYQQSVGKGLSELRNKIEQEVSRSARFYALMAKGLEIENTQGQQARPILGQANQATAGLPTMTEADLARLSARERNTYVNQTTTERLNQLLNGEASRLGQ